MGANGGVRRDEVRRGLGNAGNGYVLAAVAGDGHRNLPATASETGDPDRCAGGGKHGKEPVVERRCPGRRDVD